MIGTPSICELAGENRPLGFDGLSINIASPENIRRWSCGEVKNPETINCDTSKPLTGGLFCERIFGPTKDWECSCGKYKRLKHRDVICDRCGVQVTLARVRRERMGHIELAAPVTHIWFYKNDPSPIGLILNMSGEQLERVIYYADWLVVEPHKTGMKKGQLLTDDDYQRAVNSFGENAFEVAMGAQAIHKLLSQIDLVAEATTVRQQMRDITSEDRRSLRKELQNRLKLLRAFRCSETRPEWMVLEVIPVIPPDLRPIVTLEDDHFWKSDLNELYMRVILRSNRLRNLLQSKTPDIIIRDAKGMLQEAVDALFDNGRHGTVYTGARNRPFLSLSDRLQGKEGTGNLLTNLLAKTVDYSGRSVIVVDPALKLRQCGLPKKMVIVLFEPFIVRGLINRGYVHTVRSAKKMIDRGGREVWSILEEVTKTHLVLLSRQPALHRAAIQAFEPLLVEDDAVHISPLAWIAQNTMFDSDEVTVHVPLSAEAQMEARTMMLSSINVLSPTNGRPIFAPSGDVILGCYYLTQGPPKNAASDEKRLLLFDNSSEVEFALANRSIKIHDRIRFRNPNRGQATLFGDSNFAAIETTVGRVIFNEIWPSLLGFYNKPACKKQISDLILQTYQISGQQVTVETLERLMRLGFHWAMHARVLIGVGDKINSSGKRFELGVSRKQLGVVIQKRRGETIVSEPHAKVVDLWTHAGEEVATVTLRNFDHNAGREEWNPAGLMVDSGCLTRKLVNCAQDVIVSTEDCGTASGVVVRSISEGSEQALDWHTRLIGRTSCEAVQDHVAQKSIVERDFIINEDTSLAIGAIGFKQLRIRSVLTCESERGVCASCYGRDPKTGQRIQLGEAVGIIAAQSIGEYELQFTRGDFIRDRLQIAELFDASRPADAAIIAKNDGVIEVDGDGAGNRQMRVVCPETGAVMVHLVPATKELIVCQGSSVKKGQPLTNGIPDPHDILEILGPESCQVHLVDQVQRAHRRRNLEVADQHIEIIIRQMLRFVKVTKPGDTIFTWGDLVDRRAFEEVNRRLKKKGGKMAECSPVLTAVDNPIFKAQSLIASMQRRGASSVLVKAATSKRGNKLHGMEDQLALGKLIPAGTGFTTYRNVQIKAKLAGTAEEPLEDSIRSKEPQDFEGLRIANLSGVIGC